MPKNLFKNITGWSRNNAKSKMMQIFLDRIDFELIKYFFKFFVQH